MQNEILDVVDENDIVIGQQTRKYIHENGLIHRSVMWFTLDRDSKILVNQRTPKKDFFQDYWSIVLGGHVNSGEAYEDAIAREACEETGIRAKPIFLDSFKKRFNDKDRENVRVYAFKISNMPITDPDEIKRWMFLYPCEAEIKMKKERFLPETETLFKILKNNYNVLV